VIPVTGILRDFPVRNIHQFIGDELIPEREFVAGFNQVSYIFAVDFKEGKIRKVK
jgi:hypothetical protein